MWEDSAMDPSVREKIERAIRDHEVILFMKGTRSEPSCGFSARAVEILDALIEDYRTVDVLSHPEIREGIKEFSSWPTIPQLYVRGKFVGGTDLILQSFEDGSLLETLGLERPAETIPQITLSPAATEALSGFLTEPGDVVLIEIDRQYQAGLSVGPAPKGAIQLEVSGVPLALDRLSAGRADGLFIDYVMTKEGAAFKVQNPNEPPRVKQLSPAGLKRLMDEKAPFVLVDVRTEREFQTARIEGGRLLDEALQAELEALPRETPLVFQCHHGHRSQRAAEHYLQKGFRDVSNLAGGIDAWSLEIDQSVPRY